MNTACLRKSRNGENDLWCHVLKGKYDRDNLLLDTVLAKLNDSRLWNNLVQLWPNLGSMVFWLVRNGESVLVWDHCLIEVGYESTPSLSLSIYLLNSSLH